MVIQAFYWTSVLCTFSSLQMFDVWESNVWCLRIKVRTIQIHYYSCYLCEATFISYFYFQAIFTLIYHLKPLQPLVKIRVVVVHGHQPAAQPEPEPRGISGGRPDCKMQITLLSFFLKEIFVFNKWCFHKWIEYTIVDRHLNVIQFVEDVTQNIPMMIVSELNTEVIYSTMYFFHGEQTYCSLLTKSNFDCATIIYMCMICTKIILWWVDFIIVLWNLQRLISLYREERKVTFSEGAKIWLWYFQVLLDFDPDKSLRNKIRIYLWCETVIYSMFIVLVWIWILKDCSSQRWYLQSIRWYLLLCYYCAFVATSFFPFGQNNL